MMRMILAASMLLLTGCMTAQERVAVMDAEVNAACQRIGIGPTSPQWLACRSYGIQLVAQRERIADDQRRQAMLAIGAGLVAGAAVAAASRPAPVYVAPPPLYRRPYHCTHQAMGGGMIRTNCY